MEDLYKAVELLNPLLNGLADKGETVEVFGVKVNDDSFIIVHINNAKYKINVTCENARSMIRSVVNAVVLKI